MTRKITTILLALALCLTLLPVGAGAATTDTYELKMDSDTLLCGDTDVTEKSDVSLTVAGPQVTISGYVIGSNTGATYKLTSDVTIDKPLIITGGTENAPVTLDLCGHVLKLNSSIYDGTAEGSVIAVSNNAYFVLQDTSTSDDIHHFKKEDNGLYKLADDTSSPTTITLTGGVITGGTGTGKPEGNSSTSKYGGGVFVGSGAHFEMTGGNIVGCRATTGPGPSGCGGGVYISNSATFNMTGGCIVGCAANDGGGVNATADSTFTLSGGAIRSCTASRDGGGGVTIGEGSTFTMENGTIEGCTASGNGGGVVIEKEGTFTMVNGTIKDCTATSGKGSGVYINGKATMDAQGGSVYDSVYIYNQTGETGTLKNDSTTGGTAFYDEINNNGGTTSDKWVTFMNGNNIHAQSIVSSSGKVSKPDDPQKTGKKFLGWVTDDPTNTTHCKEFDFNTAVNDNLTLYAAWDGDFEVVVSGAQGGNGYYKTFGGAWSGAQGDSPTFKLLKDVDDAEDITCYRKGATLDLNGYKLTRTDIPISGGTGEGDERVFTVEDTSSNGDGKLDGTITVTGSKAELTVDGGTVDKVEVTNGGTLNCAGGKITDLTVSTGGTVNHTGTLGDYKSDNDNHWQVCSCCSTVVEKAAHTFGSDNKCECGYEKPRRTYRGSSTPTVSAVLSHPDAASATNYTSGIYGLTFRSTASFASFRGVQVDGKTIASSNYIAEEGSIVVYLKAVYLQTLSKGSHTVTILSTEGNTTANFTIGGVQSAKTGDTGVAIYALMALTSYTGTALVVRGRKRK